MKLGFEIRYLRIDWLTEGIARRIEAAPTPLAVEQSTTMELKAESTIFNDSYSWLGIRVEDHENIAPSMVDAAGRETPWLRVNSPSDGGVWFISSEGWDNLKHRHLSELTRSAGNFRVRIGDKLLVIQNFLSGYGRADIQAYIDDFEGSLLWLIMNVKAGATAMSGVGTSSVQLLPILDSLCTTARKILATPLVAVKEDRRLSPTSKIRATSETFRELSQKPQARRLTGRVFDESANTAENRYVRHILGLVTSWISTYLRTASQQSEFLRTLAKLEDQRAKDSLSKTFRHVDPDIYDQQTEDIARRVKALTNYRPDGSKTTSRTRKFPIRLTQRFGNGFSYFYDRIDHSTTTPDKEISFRVAVFPDNIFNLLQSSIHICRELTFEGDANSLIKTTRNEKKYRKLSFSTISSISIHNDPISARASKRRLLEEHEWTVTLTSTERKELQREAKTAALRAKQAKSKQSAIDSLVEHLKMLARNFTNLDSQIFQLGVSRSSTFPTGMTLITNPSYASFLSSFKIAAEIFKKIGFDPSLLEDVERIGILHASEIYEKWCLLKIFSILIEDFKLIPESNWAQRLVTESFSGERNSTFNFSRPDIDQRVTVTYQFETNTGRRPDFVIRFFDKLISHEESTFDSRFSQTQPIETLVLDAKFRSSWGNQSPRHLLDELIQAKGYDEIGSVFILQPCEGTVRDDISPLEWGRHCDYGARQSHNHGWIQLGLSPKTNTTDNLKRLLSLKFQSTFKAPERMDHKSDKWESRSFCIGCGESHSPQSIRSKQTKGGGMSWFLNCALCGVWTVRTHCYNCKSTLFKNGTRWTYHLTLADQVTNVICPDCGSHFDRHPNADD